jgi:alpha-tubulin suppressor-like RCC1 family protein
VYVEDSTPPPAPVISGTSPPPPSNQTTVTVTGSSEAGSTVSLYSDAACTTELGTGSAAVFSATGIVVTVLPNMTTELYVTATDAAGNTSACADSGVSFVEDSQPPATPTWAQTIPPSPSRTVTTPTLTGTAEVGSTIRVYASADCSDASMATTSANATGAFSVQVTVLPNTSTTFRASASDAAGNTSPCSDGITYVHDSIGIAPSNLTTSPPSPANNNNPSVEGVAEPGANVRIHRSAQCADPPVATGTASASGVFSLAVSVADNSTTVFYADATDVAGNDSPCSANGVTYIEDSTAPVPPLVSGTSPSPPSNENQPAVLGTAEPGSTITIFGNAACTGASLGSGTTAGDGSFRVTIRVDDNTTTELHAIATDGAGNSSPCSTSSTSYIEDSIAPAPPTLTGTTPISPSNSVANPVVSGSSEPNSTVQIYSSSSCAGAVIAAGTADSLGHFSVTVTVQPNTATSLFASASDVAGNTSACSTGGLTYVHDSMPPLFAGVSTATPLSPSQVTLTWSPATDNFALPSEILYDICRSTVPGDCAANFLVAESTSPGVTLWNVANLVPATRYYFVVRARDMAGNRETNVVELDAKTWEAGTAKTIATGFHHACAGLSDGTVRCWGANQNGQLGGGSKSYSEPAPVTVTGIQNAVGLTAGSEHTCALLADGTARCWGLNDDGRLGDGTNGPFQGTPIPVAVTTLTNSVAISAGGDFTCALLADGTARCWGANDWGQLGNDSHAPSNTPVGVSNLTSAIALSASSSVACALIADGTVRCWGETGQLFGSPVPVTVSGVTNVAALSASFTSVFSPCFLSSAGTVSCSGSPIPGLSSAVSVSAGLLHRCAVTSDRTAHCWGTNDDGELGDGTVATSSTTPVTVSGFDNVIAVASGTGFTCGIAEDGTVRCWGNNSWGQIGDGTVTRRLTATPVSGLSGVVSGKSITAFGRHTCALLSDGTARCWGYNGGDLGDGTSLQSSAPVRVTNLQDAFALRAGRFHTCSALSHGAVDCWGINRDYELGDGTTTDRYLPVSVSGLPGPVVELAAGSSGTCALMGDGTVTCWGYDGTGNTDSTPVAISGLNNITSITAGDRHFCAVSSGGTVSCWGRNDYGQVGKPASSNEFPPAPLSGISSAIAVGAGASHTCALIAGGVVQCWGQNFVGQLGDGTLSNQRYTAAAVSGLTNAVRLALGDSHSCSVLGGGAVKCWGLNQYGQIGDGTTDWRPLPALVSGLSNVVSLTAGEAHTCALLADGTPRCWGLESNGQLGDGISGLNPDGTLKHQLLPTAVIRFP